MIGVFGGTFDPVHFGHLRIALEMTEYLGLAELRLMPARQPPHRAPPQASVESRLQMLRLAIQAEPRFSIDDRELKRSGPSYMVDTLTSLRSDYPQRPIVLMLGLDAFATLHEWLHWSRLIELAHIAVAQRPARANSSPAAELQPALAGCLAGSVEELSKRVAGHTIFCPVTQLDISATAIRGRIEQGLSARYLLPEAVLNYINENGLYHEHSR